MRFTWNLESQPAAAEQVTVTFAPCGEGTEVTITHERIARDAIRNSHERGWTDCLEKLVTHIEPRRPRDYISIACATSMDPPDARIGQPLAKATAPS